MIYHTNWATLQIKKGLVTWKQALTMTDLGRHWHMAILPENKVEASIVWCLSAKLVETSVLRAAMQGKRQGMVGHEGLPVASSTPLQGEQSNGRVMESMPGTPVLGEDPLHAPWYPSLGQPPYTVT